MLSRTDNAAATPAACPVIKQPGITLIDAGSFLSYLTQRPASSVFLRPFGKTIR